MSGLFGFFLIGLASLLSPYHHCSVIPELGGPLIKVVKLQHNTGAELTK